FPIWLWLETHRMVIAFCLARASVGNNIPARMAMMAMTTRSSIKVKASLLEPDHDRKIGDSFMRNWLKPRLLPRLAQSRPTSPGQTHLKLAWIVGGKGDVLQIFSLFWR